LVLYYVMHNDSYRYYVCSTIQHSLHHTVHPSSIGILFSYVSEWYLMRFSISDLLITIASDTFSSEGVAGCWEITNKDGKLSKVDEI